MYREGVRFRYYLIHPTEGTQEIDEPVGWVDSEFTLKRDDKFHSITFEYSSPLKFYFRNSQHDGGAEYIKFVRDKYGPDGKLYLDVQLSHHDSNEWERIYYGRLELIDCEEEEKYITCNVAQDDFFTTFNQRANLPVSFKDNISVDGLTLQEYTPYNVELHSKVLVKRTDVEVKQDLTIDPASMYNITINGGIGSETAERTVHVQLDMSSVTVEELSDFWGVMAGAIRSDEEIPEIYTAKEGGTHTFDFNVNCDILVKGDTPSNTSDTWLSCGQSPEEYLQNGGNPPGLIENAVLGFKFIVKNSEDVIIYDGGTSSTSDYITNCHTIEAALPYNISFNLPDFQLNAGDKVFAYVTVYLAGTYKRKLIDSKVEYYVGIRMKKDSTVRITGKTFTTPSIAQAFRVHDLLQNLINKLTNRNDSFYSDCFGYPGAPHHSYPVKGCYADFIILDGFALRGFPWEERAIQPRFDKIYNSLVAMFNVALGLEVIGGVERIRIEPLEYFYSKEPILILDHVKGLKKTFQKEKYYNQIEIGYENWQPEEINGLDEFNAKQTWATSLQTVGSPLVLRSEVIASGSLIEVTRRSQYNTTVTLDTRQDNELFIIALNRNDPTKSERNENFPIVNNLLSPESAYNLRLSPKRCLLRHGNRINGGLIHKVDSTYKFMAGEGNYKLGTQTADTCPGSFNNEYLVENEELLWAYAELSEVDPLWNAEVVSFKYPMGLDSFNLIKANKNQCIAISGDIYEEGIFQKVFILEARKKPTSGLIEIKGLVVNDIPFNYVPEGADNLIYQDGSNILYEQGGLLIIS